VDENLRTTVGCKLIGAGDTYNCGTEVIGLELDGLEKFYSSSCVNTENHTLFENASGIASIISVAIKLTCPILSAAMSPAKP